MIIIAAVAIIIIIIIIAIVIIIGRYRRATSNRMNRRSYRHKMHVNRKKETLSR